MINLSNLKKYSGQKKKAKRLGRGTSSGQGTYSGKGQKGQRSRSGGRRGLKLRGIRLVIKRFPKNGGFRSLRKRLVVINLKTIENKFSSGDLVNAEKLFKLGLINSPKEKIKVLGSGKLTKKFIIIANAFSALAKESIIKAGGEVKLVERVNSRK
ncbi:MAG: 50S ribosomal protein L15 [Patescibacteria group bacterium]|nr:50S ribosomal protein L15 [Patescibacteria group bacterium]MDD5121037.1 50S ribosomal protein L15 [Patescibacteria group bacterium]MDD5221602.1 50S ribosomal protein L15 [Patescibacteria group bacterium]MDD5396044.1 50S ribosomal protein L15 [Patescibacteria group bacterium]